MIKQTFAFYILKNEYGNRRKSTWKMSEEDAKKRDPDAELVPGSEEVRNIPECQEEWHMTSDFMRGNKR